MFALCILALFSSRASLQAITCTAPSSSRLTSQVPGRKRDPLSRRFHKHPGLVLIAPIAHSLASSLMGMQGAVSKPGPHAPSWSWVGRSVIPPVHHVHPLNNEYMTE